MKKILILDDEAIIAMQLEELLKGFGYNVLPAVCSSKEALRLIKTESPQLILLDIKLKEKMTGIDLAKKIRHLINCEIIFITAYTDDELIRNAREVQPAAYILKPFREEEVKAAVEIALYKQEMSSLSKRICELYQSRQLAKIILDNQKIIRFFDQDAQETFGFSKEEIEQKSFFELFLPEEKEKVYNAFLPLSYIEGDFKMAPEIESRAINRDGKKFPVEISITVWKLKGQIFYTILIEDCSLRFEIDQKIAELKKEKKNYFKQIHHLLFADLLSNDQSLLFPKEYFLG